MKKRKTDILLKIVVVIFIFIISLNGKYTKARYDDNSYNKGSGYGWKSILQDKNKIDNYKEKINKVQGDSDKSIELAKDINDTIQKLQEVKVEDISDIDLDFYITKVKEQGWINFANEMYNPSGRFCSFEW